MGPDKHGVIPKPAVNTLKEVGKWMAKNGETIYGTEKNQLLNPFEYGYVTQKTTPDGKFHWYLHVSSGYWNEGKVYLYGIKEQPVSATYFADGAQANIEWNNLILTIHLPETLPDIYYTTIDLCFNQKPEQEFLSQMRNDQIRLTPYQAVTNGIRKDFQPCSLKEWYLKNNEVRYNLYLEQGLYTVQAEYAALEEGELYFKINNEVHTAHYSKTQDNKGGNGDMDSYVTEGLSGLNIRIPITGMYQLVITRNAEIPDHFNLINVRSFTFHRDAGSSIYTIPVNDVSLYPNPVKNGYFYCSIPAGETVRIYDASGRMQKSCPVAEDHIVDVSDLKAGVYFVMGKDFNSKIIIAD